MSPALAVRFFTTSATWESYVPHELTTNIKKNLNLEVLSSLILQINNEPFLDWIVMCDEKWIFYDI